ncbi:hypothetical protein SEA_SHAM_180 [Streptomyces phage Sham]|nr:hypothetical protein SEA_SHAM_180 [Streptomyces phage Sham]
MASGYTSKLHDGEQEFSEFVLDCARAFGAYIHLRDEPNAVLSKIEDDTPNRIRALDRAQQAYDEFTALSEDEQKEMHKEYVLRTRKYNEDSAKNRTEVAERYGRMLGKVIAWNPPKELENLKDFMKEQLESSIEFDCKPYEAKILEFDEWLDNHVSHLLRSIEYAEDDIEKEKKRVKEQHAWHEALLKAAQQF